MKTKFEMAHDYAVAMLKTPAQLTGMSDKDIAIAAFNLAEAMQAEADNRTTEVVVNYASKEFYDSLEVACKKEWQPDWSQAPEWANWWVIGSLTKQGIWSEAKPNSVKINGVDYWEVTSPSGDEHLSVAPSFDYTGDWRDSLRKRPN